MVGELCLIDLWCVSCRVRYLLRKRTRESRIFGDQNESLDVLKQLSFTSLLWAEFGCALPHRPCSAFVAFIFLTNPHTGHRLAKQLKRSVDRIQKKLIFIWPARAARGPRLFLRVWLHQKGSLAPQ